MSKAGTVDYDLVIYAKQILDKQGHERRDFSFIHELHSDGNMC